MFTDDDRERLASIYLFANEPSYIWSRFVRDEGFVRVKNNSNVEDLHRRFRTINIPSQKATEVAEAYALLIILIMKAVSEDEVNWKRLDWGKEILELARNWLSQNKVQVKKIEPKAVEQFEVKSFSAEPSVMLSNKEMKP